MAGLPAGTADFDRVFGNAIVAAAQALSACNGLNDLINDPIRMAPGGLAGLEAKGYDPTTAGLYVASFGDMASLYRVAHAQQAQAAENDFFFNAKLLMGTVPLL
jgi:hypothetical protein